MFFLIRTIVMRKISEAIDEKRPLNGFLRWAVKNDRLTREYYEGSLRLEKELARDLQPFLAIQEIQLSSNSSSGSSWERASAGRTENRAMFRMPVTAYVVLAAVLLGAGFYGLRNIPQTGQVALNQPTLNQPEVVSHEPAFEAFDYLEPPLDRESLSEFSRESREVLKQLPILDPTSSHAIALVVQGVETIELFP